MKKLVSILLALALTLTCALPAFATESQPVSMTGKWVLAAVTDAAGEPVSEDVVKELFGTTDYIAEFLEGGTQYNYFDGVKHGQVNRYSVEGNQVTMFRDEEHPLTLSEDGNMLTFALGDMTVTLARLLPVHGVWTFEVPATASADASNAFLTFNYDGSVDAYQEGVLYSEGLRFTEKDGVIYVSGETGDPMEITVDQADDTLTISDPAGPMQMVRSTVENLKQTVESAASKVADGAANVAGAVQEKAEEVAGAVQEEAGQVADAIKEEAGDVAENVQEGLAAEGSAVEEGLEAIKDTASNLLEKAESGIKSLWEKAESLVPEVKAGLLGAMDYVKDLAHKAETGIWNTAENVKDGLQNAYNSITGN